MSTIHFYILSDAGEQKRLEAVYHVIEKAYKEQHRIYIHANSQQQAHQLDELLWTYREESFLPHNLYGDGPDTPPPIQIGFNIIPQKQHDILINLNQKIPDFYKQFSTVFEIISNDSEVKEEGRKRFKFYRIENQSILTHQVTPAVSTS